MTVNDRAVRRWLLVSAFCVALAVLVGGITRLTESGLSITEWKPVRGVLPPLSSAAWNQAYQSYLRIPEAQTVHRGITLPQFQTLYWWEWFHRLVARGVGLVLAVPYFWFLGKRSFRPRHRYLLALLPVLALAQGALGWFMVKSGLTLRTDVSPYRLAAHLALALVIFLIAIRVALTLDHPDETHSRGALPHGGLRRAGRIAVALVLLTMVSGAFVAGLDGGRVYNTFPLMDGRIVPPGYRSATGWWRNALENPAAAQFHHRVLAIVTGLGLLALAWGAFRSGRFALRRTGTGLALAVLAQIGLGIATLLLAVPPALGVLHQAGALLVLTAAVLVTFGADSGAAGGER